MCKPVARGIFVPRAWSIDEAVAQDDGIETPRAEHLVFHIGGAFDRDRPLRIRRIERIRLGMRLAAACIAKRDALHDVATQPGQLLPGSVNVLVFPGFRRY
jgi:hypothetical protein